MKKQVLTILLLTCAGLQAFAQSVSAPQAAAIAGSIFGSGRNLAAVSSQETLNIMDGGESTFYVVNNPSGGWAIIAADNRANPVLACSATGSFPTGSISPATLQWLRGADRSIKAIRRSGLRQSAESKARWSSVGVATKGGTSEKILETAAWHQTPPFCNLCPLAGSEQTMTGCVATAMSILMRYYKWPEHGTGTVSGYTTKTRLIKIDDLDISGHVYDWENMPLEYSASATSAQKIAVATLMYDSGVMVEMDYNTAEKGGSAAFIQTVIPALAEHMSYSAGARLLCRDNYSDARWFAMVSEEIEAGRPMIYSGIGSDGSGHSFLVDGYNADGLLHINWGWGGHANGFFAVNCLGDENEESIGHIFDRNEYATFGLVPDKTGTDKSRAAVFLIGSEDLSGISLTGGTIGGGRSFTVSVGMVCNSSYGVDYKGKVKIALVDREGKFKEDVSAEKDVTISKPDLVAGVMNCTYAKDVPCQISGPVVPGDAIAVFYTEPDGSWTRMFGPTDGSTTSLLGVYDACFITGPFEYTSGRAILPELVQGHKPVKEIKWYLDGTEMVRRSATPAKGSHTLKAKVTFNDSTVETVVQTITVL